MPLAQEETITTQMCSACQSVQSPEDWEVMGARGFAHFVHYIRRNLWKKNYWKAEKR